MDFFAQQRSRKQKTYFYFILFILSLIIINIVLCLVVHIGLNGFFVKIGIRSKWMIYAFISGAFFFGVVLSLLKMLLGNGSNAIRFATYLGASSLEESKNSQSEKDLRYCVEEMSIASGVPCPNIYILKDQAGINAMAVGYNIHDSAVIVTQGALQQLNRDELQAMVAHEFGHILSGDIRINMILLAALNSIHSIYYLGEYFIHPVRSRKKITSTPYDFILGIALMLIGSMGQFFSKLIKAQISRQREFLADALAVQFTRNPQALVSTLKKIGGDRWGSRIFNPKLEKASHMMFAQLHEKNISWLSTHPSLSNRIKIYEKNFNGVFPENRKKEAMPGVESVYTQVNSAAELGSMFSPLNLVYAEHFLKTLNAQQFNWIKKEDHLKTTLYALYLDTIEKHSIEQKEFLKQNITFSEYQQCLKAYEYFKTHSFNEKIGIQDLLLPKIKKQRQEVLQEINAMIAALIDLDQKTSLFELVAYKIFQKNCMPSINNRGKLISENQVIEVLLSCLCYAGSYSQAELSLAMQAGVKFFYKHGPEIQLLSKENFKHTLLLNALFSASKFSFYKRQRFLSACYRTVMYDQKVSDKQASILRLLGEYLEFPIPISTHEYMLKNINTTTPQIVD